MDANNGMDLIRDRLAELGMTPSDLARASGVGRSQIGKYLNGSVAPSITNYFKLRSGLGLDANTATRASQLLTPPVKQCTVRHDPGSKTQRECPVHGHHKARTTPAGTATARPQLPVGAGPRRGELPITYAETRVDISAIKESAPDRARMRLRATLTESIWDAAALEGNTYTLPEVRTLLEGVTVGGKSLHETEQILGLRDAFRRLDELLATDTFSLDKETSDELHALVARHEALDAGMFRGQGTSTGGGHVRLSTGATVEGFPHGEGGSLLVDRYARMLDSLYDIDDARMQALAYFAAASRAQYYFDGNKRAARLMMTGHLVAHGYDPVSVPNQRRLEFNTALDTMFATDDATDIMALLATCTV